MRNGGVSHASVTKSAARTPANSVQLNKQLGSEQQLGESGISIAGAGSRTPLRDSELLALTPLFSFQKRLAGEHGGNASDWSKRSSSQHIASDGRRFETHWYENTFS